MVHYLVFLQCNKTPDHGFITHLLFLFVTRDLTILSLWCIIYWFQTYYANMCIKPIRVKAFYIARTVYIHEFYHGKNSRHCIAFPVIWIYVIIFWISLAKNWKIFSTLTLFMYIQCICFTEKNIFFYILNCDAVNILLCYC